MRIRCAFLRKVTCPRRISDGPGFLTSIVWRCYFSRDFNSQPRRCMVKDDQYAISVAKTEYREAYNSGDVDRLLAVFAAQFTDCSDGEPSFYGNEAVRA